MSVDNCFHVKVRLCVLTQLANAGEYEPGMCRYLLNESGVGPTALLAHGNDPSPKLVIPRLTAIIYILMFFPNELAPEFNVTNQTFMRPTASRGLI